MAIFRHFRHEKRVSGFLRKPYRWSCGESNPGPMTVPSVFYVRSLLAVRRFFCPQLLSQTTVGEHIRSTSPLPALWLRRQSKSSKRRSASPQGRGRVNGAAAHWLVPSAKHQAARANSVRLDLALILLQGTSTSGPCVLGTLPCDEQVTVETDQPHMFNYQAPAVLTGLFGIAPKRSACNSGRCPPTEKE